MSKMRSIGIYRKICVFIVWLLVLIRKNDQGTIAKTKTHVGTISLTVFFELLTSSYDNYLLAFRPLGSYTYSLFSYSGADLEI